MGKEKTIIILTIFSLIFLFSYNSESRTRSIPDSQKTRDEFSESAFQDIKLEAKAVYIFDIVKNEPIFELNADAQLPLASLAKIMTAVTAKESLPERLKINISAEAVMQEGDSGFSSGEQWQIEKILDAMLISSSNDAAFALASVLNLPHFVFSMNEKARELNLAQTYFLNPTGLDLSEGVAGAYGSARDVADMLSYALKNYSSLLEITRYETIELASRDFRNTNELVNEIPNLLGGKTGFSDLAGGNLAVVVDIGFNRPVIIVALGSSEQGRFEDVKKLYSETIKYMIKY